MVYTSKYFDPNKYFLHSYHKYHGEIEAENFATNFLAYLLTQNHTIKITSVVTSH